MEMGDGRMLQAVSMPVWLVLGTATVFAALGVLIAYDKARRAERRERRRLRRQRNVVRHRVWDWVMGGARHRRLTFQASDGDEVRRRNLIDAD
jgi:hypothetical protein